MHLFGKSERLFCAIFDYCIHLKFMEYTFVKIRICLRLITVAYRQLIIKPTDNN